MADLSTHLGRRGNQQAVNYGVGNDTFNRRFQTTGRELGALQSMSNLGQTASNQLNSAGANAATQIGQAQMMNGQINAAGTLGNANTLNNAVGSLYDIYRNNKGGFTPNASGAGGYVTGQNYDWNTP